MKPTRAQIRFLNECSTPIPETSEQASKLITAMLNNPTIPAQTTAPAASPLLAQYNAIHATLPAGTVLFYKLGDFYEVLGADAPKVAKILEITLTKRKEIPMCGIPFHCLDKWLEKLRAAGLAVAAVERLS